MHGDLPGFDWDPLSEDVQADQRGAFDRMREHCPVAHSERLGWSLFRHEDIARVLADPETFSNAVSSHLSVPNGMDPPQHGAYRRIIDPCFSAERIAAFESVCRDIAADLALSLSGRSDVEFITEFAEPFAVRAHCTFLGWPVEMREHIIHWVRQNQAATRSGDRDAMADVAKTFARHVSDILAGRRSLEYPGDDVTGHLLRTEVDGRPLTDEEIVSLLRNWTMGDVGTMVASLGIVVGYLARDPDLQARLRSGRRGLSRAIDEILRVHGPLVMNRRVTTRPVEIGGRHIPAGERISLIWISANRDGRVFDDPELVRYNRNQDNSLLFGAGIHCCPGAGLARLELRIALARLLESTQSIASRPGVAPESAKYPASGFSRLSLLIDWA